MTATKEILAARVRELRTARSLSQQELAERCDLTPNAIGLLERGELFARPETLDALAKALKVRVADLFAESDGAQERADLVAFARAAPAPLVRATVATAKALLEHLGAEKPQRAGKKKAAPKVTG